MARDSLSSQVDPIPNFDDLPSDIIRNILTVGVESINKMMKINRRWHALSHELLNNRKRLPVIDRLCWAMGPIMNDVATQIPEKYRKYFRVKYYPRHRISPCVGMRVVADRTPRNALTRLISRCSRVGKFELVVAQTKELREEMDFLTNLLMKTEVEELIISKVGLVEPTFQSALLDLICARPNAVHRLVLNPWKIFENEKRIIDSNAWVEFFSKAEN